MEVKVLRNCTHLDVVILEHRGMIPQVRVDVWSKETGNFWPHTMLNKEVHMHVQYSATHETQ